MDWLPLLDLTELTALLIALCPTLPDLGADFTFRPLLDRFASVLAADVLAFGVDLGFRSVFAALLAAALPGLFERAIGYLLILRVRLSLAMAFPPFEQGYMLTPVTQNMLQTPGYCFGEKTGRKTHFKLQPGLG